MFNKSKPSPDVKQLTTRGPAHASLHAHLRRMTEIDVQRRQKNERAGALNSDINAVEPCAQEIAQLQATIDARRVAAAIESLPPPDLSTELQRLDELVRRHAVLIERAKVATQARAQLEAESDALLQQYRPLQPQLSRLCVDALLERMQSYAPALAEAERQYRVALRRVFLHACAIDQLSASNRLGIFVDSLRYTLHVPALPLGPPFDSLLPNRFQVNEDFASLQTEADTLIGRILQGGDADA